MLSGLGFLTFPVLSQETNPGRRPDPMHRSEKEKDLGSRSTERSPMVLSEEQDQTKRNERKDEKKDEKNGTEVNTKMSRPRTLLEQLHWKAAQFSHPHVEPGPSIPVRQRDRAKDHPKNLPTPNRKASEPRKADGPKERGKWVNYYCNYCNMRMYRRLTLLFISMNKT
jgi:hypothetical protein